ncbi:MAG: hypothetical protein PF692_04690 [Kiritimatiellae bacterium]|jgi:hypothetical protein|nr:hypothetical protein [Kiritimatiellia bacterium]
MVLKKNILTVIFFVNICVLTCFASALPDNMKIKNGFEEQGDTLVCDVSKGEARLVSKEALQPGFYAFTAEYCTKGFSSSGQFASDVKTSDRSSSLSGYEWYSTVSEWSPILIYFRVEKYGHIQIRWGNWKNADTSAKLLLRDINISRFEMSEVIDKNILTDGSFDSSQEGFVPSDWFKKIHESAPGDIYTVPNSSYRSGKYILKMTGDGTGGAMLQSRFYPLPQSGELELSVWARSTDEG